MRAVGKKKKALKKAAPVLKIMEEAAANGAKFATRQRGDMWLMPRPGKCKFIFGEGEDRKLCGHKHLPNKPYCEAHMSLCYTTERPEGKGGGFAYNQRKRAA
jgi:hypothetical protein